MAHDFSLFTPRFKIIRSRGFFEAIVVRYIFSSEFGSRAKKRVYFIFLVYTDLVKIGLCEINTAGFNIDVDGVSLSQSLE